MKISKEGRQGVRVFIADDGPDTFEFLKNAVTGNDGWRIAGEARTLDTLLALADEALADVWLVSSAWLGLLSKDELRRVKSANPEAIIIAVVDSPDFAELKASLRRGARDVITYDASAEDVRELIENHYYESVNRRELVSLQAPASLETRLIDKGESTAASGHITLITGGDGGTGKSFIAAQLAGIIARHAKARTCLVDLDCEFGSLSVTLGAADTGRSLLDLIQVADELEAGQVENVINEHPDGFYLIPGAVNHSQVDGPIGTGQVPVRAVISILKELFDVVICDIPQELCDTEIISEADSVYIITTPDKTGAHCAGRLASRFAGVRLIVNMADRRGAISAAKMAEACGLPIAAAVPEDVGAGRLFDKDGEILAARTNLAVTRSLIPVAQRCRHFEELAARPRPVWLRGLP